MIPEHATSIRTALKKAGGMIARLERMLDDDKYCIDIAQQVNATIGLLRNVNRTILVNHLQTCGKEKLTAKDAATRQAFIEELLQVTDVAGRKL